MRREAAALYEGRDLAGAVREETEHRDKVEEIIEFLEIELALLEEMGHVVTVVENGQLALDALAHRQPPAIVLALDLVGPAHGFGQALAMGEFVEFGLPAHAARLRMKSRVALEATRAWVAAT